MTWQMMTCRVSAAKSEAKVLWSLWVVVSVKRGNEMNKKLLKVPFGLLFISSFSFVILTTPKAMLYCGEEKTSKFIFFHFFSIFSILFNIIIRMF
jgi:hypothetical protein